MHIVTMPLEQLKPAPYNPRVDLQPNDPRYRKLLWSVRTFGLVEVTGGEAIGDCSDFGRPVIQEHLDQVQQQFRVTVVGERQQLLHHTHIQDWLHASPVGGMDRPPPRRT